MEIKKIICYIFGHKWIYNFSWMPSRAICSRCFAKAEFDLSKLEWNSVELFKNEKRTNKQLINQWKTH